MKKKSEKNYYEELKRKIEFYEEHPWCDDERHTQLSAISNKIVWCWDWKKITEEQLHELCDRTTALWNKLR